MVDQDYLAVQLIVGGLLLGCRMMVVALFSCSGGVLVLVGRIDCGGWIFLFGGNRRGVVLLLCLVTDYE